MDRLSAVEPDLNSGFPDLDFHTSVVTGGTTTYIGRRGHPDINLDSLSDDYMIASDRLSKCEQLFTDDMDGFYGRLAATSDALPYELVDIEPTLPLFKKWEFEENKVGGFPSQMRKEAWLAELAFENDYYLKSYLRDGICEGFKIIDDIERVPSYDNQNYNSVLVEPAFSTINDLILKEICESKYLVVDCKPKCIHSLGAVVKSNGTYRPITDCSRPLEFSINSYMENAARVFKYQCVDYVCELMNPGDYSATIDISAAYRSVSVFPSYWTCQGIRWNINGVEKFLVDTRLCFGLRSAPYIFTQISNFVVRAMARRGIFKMANYLDDYIVFAPTCQLAS